METVESFVFGMKGNDTQRVIMSENNNKSTTLLFIREVAKYFMDFLETDFHKRRLPKRNIQLHSKDNLLVGLNLNKYPSFNRLIWELIIKNFDKPIQIVRARDLAAK